jgi:gamma-glutamylcyclotransferase (GGCT)/AIG2-like uncharacterized protein YtfP
MNPSPMHQVFVYGTLKPQEAAYEHYCQPYVIQTQPAYMQGALFHLPQGYPAMTVGDRWIAGALLTFAEAEAIARIDQFEDYDPTRISAANLYQRYTRPVFATSTHHSPIGTAWVYLMLPQRVQALGGVPVDSGTWSRQQFPSINAV